MNEWIDGCADVPMHRMKKGGMNLLGESGLADRVAKLLAALHAAFHGLIVGLGPASGPALLES
jgi:hypothetical protein